MRVEPYGVDSFLHIVKRGARGLPIVREESDRIRFKQLLYYLNDEYRSDFWEREIHTVKLLERPTHWPERRPLVKIIAWTLMSNHFHLLLQETQEGGTSRFMQSICGSMSRHFNEKYKEHGSIFQGPYRARTIDTDQYLRWAISYILVKNVFELYPRGFECAVEEFDTAWKWASDYPYSSLGESMNHQPGVIIDTAFLRGIFSSSEGFKKHSREVVEAKLESVKFPQI